MQSILKLTLSFAAAAVLMACTSAPQTQRDVYQQVLQQTQKQVQARAEDGASQEAPHIAAAGDDALALRATPSPEHVAEIYHWVHTHSSDDIEARLRAEFVNTTRRLYTPAEGAGVKFLGADAVLYWSAKTGQVRRGTWAIEEGKFGPQICETFYGQTECLNTAEQLSGVGAVDKRADDVFGLARGLRPRVNEDGLPSWP